MPTFIDPDNPNGNNNSNNEEQNTTQRQQRRTTRNGHNGKDTNDYLKSIDDSLKKLLDYAQNSSQSNSRIFRDDLRNRRSGNNYTYRTPTGGRSTFSSSNRYDPRNRQMGDFFDEFEKEILKNFLGSGYEQRIRNIFLNMADEMGVAVEDIPGMFGKELGSEVNNWLKKNPLGRILEKKVQGWERQAEDEIQREFNKGYNRYQRRHGQAETKDPYSEILERTRQAASNNTKSAEERREDREEEIVKNVSTVSNSVSTSTNSLDEILKHVINIEQILTAAMTEASKKKLSDMEFNRRDVGDNTSLSDVMALNETVAADSAANNNAANATGGNFKDVVSDVVDQVAEVGDASEKSSSGIGALLSGVLGLAKGVSKTSLVLAIVDKAIDFVVGALKKLGNYIFGPLKEGMNSLKEETTLLWEQQSNFLNETLKNEQERIKADVETLVREPFEILKDAAQEWYNFWDNQMHTINQTQGYDKADLQDLMSAYAQRLRDEGLTNVVSSADIGESLAKVIQSGLTGAAAEEFAYQATVLGAAVPTQDFFSYADQYAEMAAMALQSGKSQAEAIEYANQQLKEFASSVIYSSRATGGFAAGLKDTSSLLSDAVAIAQSAKTGNVSDIAGVLTSVAGTIGSIAPDLSSSLVDNVVKAAIGGNSSELVALRSLAGVNASNTEFLKALATDAQGVFATIFKNLAQYQNMAPEAYMEVAEGLSSIFGVSMDAFARVDFNYLAEQISKMNVNTASLEENLALLASGESTTTTEQLRMRQINEYMINEGLSYVLDNEASRAIQEHMWQEQIAQEIMENEYAVDIRGKAYEVLNAIQNIANHIGYLLNPKNWFKPFQNLLNPDELIEDRDEELLQMLELGKVGAGNETELYNLITRGQKLELIDPLVTLMGDLKTTSAETMGDIGSAVSSAMASFSARTDYTWGTVTKSAAGAASQIVDNISGVSDRLQVEKDQREQERQKMVDAVNQMLDPTYMAKFIGDEFEYDREALGSKGGLVYPNKEGTDTTNQFVENKSKEIVDSMKGTQKTYEDWVASAKKFGIDDWEAALAAAGLTEADVRNQYEMYETNQGALAYAEEFMDEKDFRNKSRDFFAEQLNRDDIIIENQRIQIEDFRNWVNGWKDATNIWLRDEILNESYQATRDMSKVQEVTTKEKAGPYDRVVQLAETMADNATKYGDPITEAVAILSKILLSVISIDEEMQKETTSNGFLDSLVALANGTGNF